MLAQTEAGKPAFRVTAPKGTLSGDRKDVFFTRQRARRARRAAPATPGEAPGGTRRR